MKYSYSTKNQRKNFSGNNQSTRPNKPTTEFTNRTRKNLSAEIPISYKGLTKHGKEYNGQSLIGILEYLQMSKIFTMISIPVWIDFNYVDVKEPQYQNKKFIIGYMKCFKDNAYAVVTIYKQYVESFTAIPNPIIIPRVTLNKDTAEVKCIVGLDIMDESKIDTFIKAE